MGDRFKTPVQARINAGESVRADRADHGAKVSQELPPCPQWLSKNARKHWDTLAPKLLAAGLISNVDGDVFAMHCANVADYEAVCAKLTCVEDWIASTPNGYAVQSAYLQIRNRLQEMIIKTGREFGLTPSARSSIKSGPTQGSLFDGADPFAPRVS